MQQLNIVVCHNEVSSEMLRRAEEQSIVIISTPHDVFTTARLINQSIPVKYLYDENWTSGLPFTWMNMWTMMREVMTKTEIP